MSTKIYKKIGRRYVEVGTYDDEQLYYPHGASLVFSRKGGALTRFNIEPADAALLAASERAKDAMLEAMHQANRVKPDQAMTKRHQKAWEAYKAIAGDQSLRLAGASFSDIIDAGLKALREAAKK